MSDDDGPLAAAIAHINEGQPVDWSALEATAATDSFRARVEELKIIERVATFARAAPPDAADETSPPLVSWGQLKLLESLGSGKFGEVYRAWDSRLDREVALKLLRHGAPDPGSLTSSVIEEGRLLGRVRHPNVATIYGADRIGDRVGIWMEFVRGQSLQELVESRGPLGADEVMAIGVDLADALAAVHRAGVLHRDVKASNVMRTDDGRTVLMDFGAGIDVSCEEGGDTLAGTPAYLAPEVLAGHPPSVQSDIYSLGVLLYYLASGQVPVPGRTLTQLREFHRRGRTPSIRAFRQDLPEGLAAAIDRASSKDPSARQPTAEALQTDLRSIVTTLPRQGHRRSVFAIVAVTIAGLAVWAAASGGFVGRSEPLTVARLWVDAGGWGPTTLDGQLLACAPATALAVCNLRDGSVTALAERDHTGGPGAMKVISPDGNRVAYQWQMARSPGELGPALRYEIRILDVINGGQPRVLQATGADGFPGVAPDAWTADSQRILARVQYGPDDWGIVLMDPVSGDMERLESSSRPLTLARLSPDGRYLTYSASTNSSTDIFIRDLSAGNTSVLVAHPAEDQGAIWRPDGEAIAFGSQRGGTWGLWLVRVEEGRAVGDPVHLLPLGRDPNLRPLSFTSTGSLTYWVETGGLDVYTSPLDAVTGTIGEAQRVAANPLMFSATPDWSPDGKRLAYAAATIGRPWDRRFDVVVQDLDSGVSRAYPISTQPHQTTVRWTRDGRSLWVRTGDASSERTREIQVIDVATGRTTIAGAVPPAFFEYASEQSVYTFGPRGLVEFNLESGARRVLHATEPAPIPAQAWSLSPDRQMLAFTRRPAAGDFEQVLQSVSGSQSRVVMRTGHPCFAQTWWGDGLLVSCWRSMQDRRSRLFLVPASGGEARALGPQLEQIFQSRVSPGGHYLAFTAGGSHNEIWTLENIPW